MLIDRIVDFIRQDEDQQNCLQQLVQKRGGDLEMYITSGILYIPPREVSDEWAYICEQLGVTEQELGISDANRNLLDDGFILPILDSDNHILFYLNYNFDRDASMKYFNVNTTLAPHTDEVKMYGLHNTEKAFEWDTIFVLEGYFDARRLEYTHGYPTSAPLGTKIMPYHINFYSRFSNVIYIQDNDKAGELGYKKFKEQVPHARVETMPLGFKDTDKLAQDNLNKYMKWANNLYPRHLRHS